MDNDSRKIVDRNREKLKSIESTYRIRDNAGCSLERSRIDKRENNYVAQVGRIREKMFFELRVK